MAVPEPVAKPVFRVLGVDPGTRVAGWGVIDVRGSKASLVSAAAIRTRADSVPGRLAELHAALVAVVAKWKPACVAIETPFFGRNANSALVVGMARGIAVLTAAEAGLPVHEYPPATIKKAVVGRGGASKEQVAAMVRVILGLREVPKPADVTDALAIALTHIHRAGAPPGSPVGRRGGSPSRSRS